MFQSALNEFIPITNKLEGAGLRFMYKDNRGLVTTGTGNLIDPVSAALAAGPWYHPDGSEATDDEVTANWNLVKNDDSMDVMDGGMQYEHLAGNNLRLSTEGVNALVQRQLNNNIGILRNYFPKIDEWPADAQLGTLLMSWGLGPAFSVAPSPGYPSFTKAANALMPDWRKASDESTWSNINHNRDVIQRQLFMNADFVQRQGRDPSVLIYPEVPALGMPAIAKTGGIGLGGILLILGGAYGASKIYQHRAPIAAYIKDKYQAIAPGGRKPYTEKAEAQEVSLEDVARRATEG